MEIIYEPPFSGFTVFMDGRFTGVVKGRVGKKGVKISKCTSEEAKKGFELFFS
jgi:hypothetical protein